MARSSGLQALGAFAPPTLSQLEDALDDCIRFTGAVVTVDLWDIDRLTACATCRDRARRSARTHQPDRTRRATRRLHDVWSGDVSESCEVAIVGSGFAGSLLARVLAVLGYDVVLLERGTHPRFAIGESSTPLANLSLERLGARYGLADCYAMATHGRWVAHYPDVRRGLKRGFTFYRHHPGEPFANRGFESERLLVAASPDDEIVRHALAPR